MPQLNPSPWLLIMLSSWLVLLMGFSQKITASPTQTPPQPRNQVQTKNTPWNWPWA